MLKKQGWKIKDSESDRIGQKSLNISPRRLLEKKLAFYQEANVCLPKRNEISILNNILKEVILWLKL
jgi:hypothetical protein